MVLKQINKLKWIGRQVRRCDIFYISQLTRILNLVRGRRGSFFQLELAYCYDRSGKLMCNKKYSKFALKNAFIIFEIVPVNFSLTKLSQRHQVTFLQNQFIQTLQYLNQSQSCFYGHTSLCELCQHQTIFKPIIGLL